MFSGTVQQWISCFSV